MEIPGQFSVEINTLANPDLPIRLAEAQSLREFDPSILGPIADIKDTELAL
ncbi:hypothetical protein [Agrobacterium radiobacter]|uniref:hypothetical protein n=1 Tax=Agrobacterium radiobacter TaxID=362 RepID=UPI003466CD51